MQIEVWQAIWILLAFPGCWYLGSKYQKRFGKPNGKALFWNKIPRGQRFQVVKKDGRVAILRDRRQVWNCLLVAFRLNHNFNEGEFVELSWEGELLVFSSEEKEIEKEAVPAEDE